jgi:hypothetical protein
MSGIVVRVVRDAGTTSYQWQWHVCILAKGTFTLNISQFKKNANANAAQAAQ